MLLSALLLTASLLTDYEDISSALLAQRQGDAFAVTGTISCLQSAEGMPILFSIEDGKSALGLHYFTDRGIRPGLQICATGYIRQYLPDYSHALVTNLTILSEGPVPAPRPTTIAELNTGTLDNYHISITGNVYAAFQDEIDSEFCWLALEDSGHTGLVAFHSGNVSPGFLDELRHARIELHGCCRHIYHRTRRLISRTIYIGGISDIRILTPPPTSDYDVPNLEDLNTPNPPDVFRLGRRKTAGTVLATWQGRHFLLKSDDGEFHNIETAGADAPPVDTRIEAVGLTETDLYRINFSDAIWRKVSGDPATPPVFEPTTAKMLLTEHRGKPGVNATVHGKAVRVSGTVMQPPDTPGSRGIMLLDCGDVTLPVDVSASGELPDALAVGCRAEISGIAIIRTENWKPNRTFPRTDGVTLVVRHGSDIRILSRPPWWTVRRLFAVICALLAVIAGISVWNRFLNRLVEQRGRRLAKESIATARAQLKVEERTRLAVELHDTIAQNLTGIALQLDTIELAAEHDPRTLPARIRETKTCMDSCREDLRNCLWDLRNRAFEEKTLDAAIRKTLSPHLGTATLDTDCRITCSRISDNALHHILTAVRELAVNAIRHGKAEHIRISGDLSNGRLDLTVADNGLGFDPTNRPSSTSGHFGLQGVAERVLQLEGEFRIESSPGHGATATLQNLRTDI